MTASVLQEASQGTDRDFFPCQSECVYERLSSISELLGARYLAVVTEPSSGIFSSEQLLPESLSWCLSSLKRSATHCAVSRASGSWSQHSIRVSHTIWMPCGEHRESSRDGASHRQSPCVRAALVPSEVQGVIHVCPGGASWALLLLSGGMLFLSFCFLKETLLQYFQHSNWYCHF